MGDLKGQIVDSLDYAQYRKYYGQEVGELGKIDSGGNAKVNCVFHEETAPSLSINLFNGLYHCFGCKAEGSIFDFHMKKHGTDFKGSLEYFATLLGIDPTNNNPKKKPSRSSPKKKKSLGTPSKIYQYKDINGKVTLETCRYEDPKDFRQRKPHPTKPKEFIWNLKDIEIIPYNLSAVAKSDTLYICEGEKDCDRLAQVGLTATTNPLGAGKWPDSLTPYFKNKTVILLPDNDNPGEAHAKLVAQKLHGTAKSIQIVNLPNLPPAGDVSDWLAAGNTKADLLEVIKNQKPYEDHIDFLNKNHAIISVGGKTCILNEIIDPVFNRHSINLSSLNDLKLRTPDLGGRKILILLLTGLNLRTAASMKISCFLPARMSMDLIIFGAALHLNPRKVIGLFFGIIFSTTLQAESRILTTGF